MMIAVKAINDAIARAQRNAPVDVDGLCAELGIRLHKAYLEQDISGELIPQQNDKYQINVNADHPLTRQRFTIAHEIGHFIFHRHLIGEGLDDNRAYRSTNQGKYHNTSIGPEEETEANRFAAGLLMPKHLLDKHTKSGVNEADIADLAQLFGVSERSMKIRLEL